MKILACSKISDQGIFLNGIQQSIEKTTNNWKKELYIKLGVEYPKFYKMDALAKMAFLGFELISNSTSIDHLADDELSLLFANKHSSYDTDQKYVNSYMEKGSPGPSLFVYTLPNILTGELSIRNKWYGENIFFIQEKFDPEFFIDQINFYFSKGSNACLCGWVDSAKGIEECFLFLVENKAGELSIEELNNYYKQ